MSTINYSSMVENGMKYNIITWRVPDFITFLQTNTIKEFRSKKIPENSLMDIRFQYKMIFLGSNNDSIEISYLSPDQDFLRLKLHICLQYRKRNLVNTYQTSLTNVWHNLATLNKADILQVGTRPDNQYLKSDGSLNLEFKFLILMKNEDIFPIQRSYLAEAEFAIDLHYLLTNGCYSDVTIKSCEGDEYKAHKAVLICRSKVLKAHFEHNTIENVTNNVECPFETKVLKEILTFIYSNKASKVEEFPEKLLAAAEFYELNGLKIICEEALHKRLNVENAIKTLELADLYSAHRLKHLTLEFIKDSPIGLIMKTDGWAKLKSEAFIKQINEYINANDSTVEYINITPWL